MPVIHHENSYDLVYSYKTAVQNFMSGPIISRPWYDFQVFTTIHMTQDISAL